MPWNQACIPASGATISAKRQVTVTINKAALTVTASGQNKTYGDDDG
jgi:hypothetical protein